MRAFQISDCRLQVSNCLRSSVRILTFAFCILTLALVRSANAQSFFNSRGLGELTGTGDARLAAIGDPFALSTQNPGIFVNLNQASFHVSAIGAATVGTQEGNSRLLRDVRPAAFNVATPLPFQTRLFAGINQKFGQDFDVWSESLADTAYRRHIAGRGGIYSLRAGLAKSLFDKVCIGAEYAHVMGGSREKWRFEIEQGGYTSTDTIEIDYAGNTLKVGASLQTRFFSLAGYYEPSLDLRVQRYKRVHGVVGDTTRTYRLSLPQSLSFAGSINPTRRLGFDLGLTLNPWSGATITKDDSLSGLGFSDVWRGSIGAQYDIDSLHPVRVGYSRQTWYYGSYGGFAAPPEWGPPAITENAVHLGTSVPIPKFGSLDISGEILFRSSYLMKETAGRLMLTLAYSEAWAKRTRRWGY
jgi:hypothetical protein